MQAEMNIYMWTEAHMRMRACVRVCMIFLMLRSKTMQAVFGAKRGQQMIQNIIILSLDPGGILRFHVVRLLL